MTVILSFVLFNYVLNLLGSVGGVSPHLLRAGLLNEMKMPEAYVAYFNVHMKQNDYSPEERRLLPHLDRLETLF